ncbi:23S rRNA (adenine(2030)-N(6))-methyltransferase RlmJ [Alteromonas sp. ASW11-19]|uniref:Ribosomal RNA large subunit methyltransferase J n=1 Tax=Alteromonas salexigens TaxID=2982530 RepID=A0ABT2VMS8_9ALTE|nr:23S rRNA (adenine(2030)-N(6))-methyltransferase RlmJ [Alteromonas salexigens]MCU7554183.1 23S rRNA (adenine(2030)-N(6))-methyltransferase RlmJ [Alteromonas salexigens]
MLSYQHAYHAGNHADVIKHVCWVAIIEYLKNKAKPFTLFDTHAGAGLYHFDADEAQKTSEFETGIVKLNSETFSDETVTRYLELCAGYTRNRQYPGSPALAADALRSGDSLHAMELHPAESDKLTRNLTDRGEGHVHLHYRDGLEGLVAMAPPRPNRGAVLIDPSYERLEEYAEVVDAVAATLARWPQAQIMVWYPLLSARAGKKAGASEAMRNKLADLAKTAFYADLTVTEKETDTGMYGSGVCILNPSWQLDETVTAALNCLAPSLADNADATVNWLKTEPV